MNYLQGKVYGVQEIILQWDSDISNVQSND